MHIQAVVDTVTLKIGLILTWHIGCHYYTKRLNIDYYWLAISNCKIET